MLPAHPLKEAMVAFCVLTGLAIRFGAGIEKAPRNLFSDAIGARSFVEMGLSL